MKKEDVVTHLSNSRIEVRPRLYPQVPKKRDRATNATRLRIAGENASLLAGYLYEALFGGEAAKPNQRELGQSNDLNSDRFQPDHILTTPAGTTYTEIKLTSGQSAQPFCCSGQFFHYYHALLNALKTGEEIPQVNYAFSRYGPSHGSLKLGRETNTGLGRVLSKQINNLTVVPLNLAIFLMMHSRFEEPDQISARPHSVQRGYWRPSGKDITTVHTCSPAEAIKEIRKRGGKQRMWDISPRELLLNELRIERYDSPENLYIIGEGGRPYRVKPFPITVYRNADPQKWAERARKRFTRFANALGGDPTADHYAPEPPRPEREYDPDETRGDTSFNIAEFTK